ALRAGGFVAATRNPVPRNTSDRRSCADATWRSVSGGICFGRNGWKSAASIGIVACVPDDAAIHGRLLHLSHDITGHYRSSNRVLTLPISSIGSGCAAIHFAGAAERMDLHAYHSDPGRILSAFLQLHRECAVLVARAQS